jgi:hypothetical protein
MDKVEPRLRLGARGQRPTTIPVKRSLKQRTMEAFVDLLPYANVTRHRYFPLVLLIFTSVVFGYGLQTRSSPGELAPSKSRPAKRMERTLEEKDRGVKSRGACIGFVQPLLESQFAHFVAHLVVELPGQVGIELYVVVHLLILLS